MARSWDARVRGADQKKAAVDDDGTPGSEHLSTTTDAAVEGAEATGVGSLISDAFSEMSLVVEGLSIAVTALDLAVAVVERSSGEIRWSSDAWVERFGVKHLFSRHLASTTEFGESPLPAPGQSWQRTRTLHFADGAEDLVDLVMIGAISADGTDFVTIVAQDPARSESAITDRAEVTKLVDGAVADVGVDEMAVLYVDLDRFKVVHDLVGNIEALRLLDLVHRRISSTVRGSDLVFRLPSDEFVILACELEEADAAEQLAERVRLGVATLADVGHDMALTASVGVALCEKDQSGSDLISAAETAVYLAKGRGRNRVAIHDEELRNRSQRLLVVERQLRRAIDRRDVRFAYQPVVEIETGRIVGAEALLRLGGDLGLSAVEVVAAAEHSGLMGALGSLVIQGVEEQLADMLADESEEQVVMINLSASQLADVALLETLRATVDNPNIKPGRFAIEVPELVVRERRDGFELLADLIRPTFRLGIDGFGASYSSYDLLNGLPVDYVKLHRSITGSLGGESEDRARISQLIADATGDGIRVVALGVERLDQAKALKSMGCDLAQGFLYAGAVTADDLRELKVTGLSPDMVAN